MMLIIWPQIYFTAQLTYLERTASSRKELATSLSRRNHIFQDSMVQLIIGYRFFWAP